MLMGSTSLAVPPRVLPLPMVKMGSTSPNRPSLEWYLPFGRWVVLQVLVSMVKRLFVGVFLYYFNIKEIIY